VSPSLNRQKIEKLSIPSRSKQTRMIAGSAKEAASQLVEQLKNEARVI
jgi:electron transfer flavoprotein alpha/beta subunit